MPDVTADPTTEPEVEPPSEEDKSAIRRTFVILTFVAGCILLPPRQWVSAAILFVVSGALLVRHRRITKREAARSKSVAREAAAAKKAAGEAPRERAETGPSS